MSISHIEDLNVWQESRLLSQDIYTIIKKLPVEEKYNASKHLRENARGTPANIAEGFYRFHYQDSIRFYLIARGCLGELKSDLYLCFDQKYITEEEFKQLLERVSKIFIMLNGLIKSTRNQKQNNSKN